MNDHRIAQLAPLERQAALEFARLLLERLPQRVLDVRVFGSRARGEAGPDSDLDILVLLDDAPLNVQNSISDMGCDLLLSMDLPFCIAPRVMAQEQYERLRMMERLFPAEIERDGIPL